MILNGKIGILLFMKKNSFYGIVLIALGIITVVGASTLFHVYADSITAAWRPNEWTMPLETMRVIVCIGGAVSVLGIVLFLITRTKELKRQEIMALIFVALGLFTIIGFLTAFHPCTDMMPGNNRPMRCVWTMRVLFGITGAISISGFLMLLDWFKEHVKGLSIGVILLGVVYLLIPTMLTGVCVVHICVTRFQPFVLVMGSVILLAAIINTVLLHKRKED